MWGLELMLYAFIFVMGILALEAKNLLVAVVVLSVFSFAMALLFVTMGAVDVAFTEAVVGAGLTGILFIVAIHKTSEKTDE
jgi:energy-converting hydrogenase B subunit D